MTHHYKLLQYFLSWQCRIRQICMREDEGRPSSGMCPRVLLKGGVVVLEAMNTVLIPKEPKETTDQFCFIVKKTNNPKSAYDKGLEILCATHFHDPNSFSDQLTALFQENAQTAQLLINEKHCLLHFEQFSQEFHILCTVERLLPESPAWQATFWHNHLFNNKLSDQSIILEFIPDWAKARATPKP